MEDIEDYEIYRKYVIKFVIGVKALFAEYITQNYDVTYRIAMSVLRVNENKIDFTISMESPETYSGKAQKIVSTIMKNDLGSMTEKIRPLYILKEASDQLSKVAQLMWIEYVAARDRGGEQREQ
jgi:hypothetical protein